MHYTCRYTSPIGGITMASDGTYLTGLWFDRQKHFAATLHPEHCEKELPVFNLVRQWLEDYFKGRQPDFTPPLQLVGTPFQRAVWEILKQIPYGEVITYKQIASRIVRQQGLSTMSAQAVGGAVGKNPISLIIPCHRVIGSNGQLTGYAGGLDKKEALLAMEGVKASLFTQERGIKL